MRPFWWSYNSYLKRFLEKKTCNVSIYLKSNFASYHKDLIIHYINSPIYIPHGNIEFSRWIEGN